MQSNRKTKKSSDALTERKNRFATVAKPLSTSNDGATTTTTVIGTCEKLEKAYFRLTNAPDPSTVRPLPVLERAFDFVLDKYRSTHDWNYLSSQLKSIRQDLMVQEIRNDFTLRVYEENARLALEMNDREQFVQCQSQIELLHESGAHRTNYTEFLLYRYLYSLMVHDYPKCDRILNEMNFMTMSDDLHRIQQFSFAFRRKDFFRFFEHYLSLPYLCQCLVKIFLDHTRKQALQSFIWGFAPTLPLDFICKVLAYPSIELCSEHLQTLGIVLVENSTLIDCKTSRKSFSSSFP